MDICPVLRELMRRMKQILINLLNVNIVESRRCIRFVLPMVPIIVYINACIAVSELLPIIVVVTTFIVLLVMEISAMDFKFVSAKVAKNACLQGKRYIHLISELHVDIYYTVGCVTMTLFISAQDAM